ncbi:ribosomal protein S2 [Calocera cornea HHB12733]|uniref:Ribosomal protein S2 n=1 Tax=Calocera cornea HHB12733 TaxID=1353952 RepID=A0A165HW34_9BASI|nr:ribosomal protein S2 [Calocera cornea HHB12733]
MREPSSSVPNAYWRPIDADGFHTAIQCFDICNKVITAVDNSFGLATRETQYGEGVEEALDGNQEEEPSTFQPEDLSSAEWYHQVQERIRRKQLRAMFEPLGSSQNRENTFQAFHSLNRPVSSSELTLSALMAAGAHLGAHRSRSRPTFLPYVYGRRANIDIIDLDQTLAMFRRAANFLRLLTTKGGTVLWVGTEVDMVKRAAKKASDRVGVHSFHISDKWMRGIFTNASALIGPEVREGDYLPDAAVFLNPRMNLGALRECHGAMVPTIGIIDSDTDPRIVTYAIPANDESPRAVELISGVLSVAAREGVTEWQAIRAREKAQKARRVKEWEQRQAQQQMGPPEE